MHYKNVPEGYFSLDSLEIDQGEELHLEVSESPWEIHLLRKEEAGWVR